MTKQCHELRDLLLVEVRVHDLHLVVAVVPRRRRAEVLVERGSVCQRLLVELVVLFDKFRNEDVNRGVEIGTVVERAGNDQRRARLVDQNAVRLIHDGDRVRAMPVPGRFGRTAGRVVEIVERTLMTDRVVVMSLKYDRIQKIRAMRPDWTYGLLTTVNLGDATRFDVDFLAVNALTATRGFVERAHRAGLEVYVWTVNDPYLMSALMSRNVDGIITDDPGLAREVLRIRAGMDPVQRLLVGIGRQGRQDFLVHALPGGLVFIHTGNVEYRQQVDVGQAGERTFMLRVAMGLAADHVIGATREMKDRYGELAYTISALKEMEHPKTARYRLTLDGEGFEVEGVTCRVDNSGNFGHGLSFSKNTSVSDGLLDVTIVRDLGHASRWSLLTDAIGHGTPDADAFHHWDPATNGWVTAPGDYDLVIRNGEIYDGSGAASFSGDIAIRDGLIAAGSSPSTVSLHDLPSAA